MADPTPPSAPPAAPVQATVAVVLQVRDGRLQALLWQRAKQPQSGRWALPGGVLARGESLDESIRRHLAAKVDVQELAHLEQLETQVDPEAPRDWQVTTAFLGLVPSHLDPAIPGDTQWHPVDALPPLAFDNGATIERGRDRLRAKLSYTNLGFALAPPEFSVSELRAIYVAALGHAISATNLQRVLLRRGVLEQTGARREPGPSGGRPAALFRFRVRSLEITDQFAVLRPRRTVG